MYIAVALIVLLAAQFLLANANSYFERISFRHSDKRTLQKRAAQASTTTAYVCVPAGTCTTNTNTIDPRAGSPTICPTGQVPCYGGQITPTCGIRYARSASTADGPTTLGAYPWQTYIVNQTMFTGSGVLIDQYHVLTIAHKVNLNINAPSNVRVYLGVWNPADMSSTQNMTVNRIILHPNFNSNTLKNDIAILRLTSPATLGLQVTVGTACLPNDARSYVGQSCVVAGWGQTAFGANDAPSNAQRQVTVPVVDYNTCRASMSQSNNLGNMVDRYLDSATEICAGGKAQIDACTQDGGSPLICQDQGTQRFYVVGLVTWGKRCGQPNVYGVYTYVPYYLNWITQTIASLNAE